MVINDYATHPHLSTISLFPQVNVTILDINDNAPLWRDEPYNANVVEMSPINTDVITVSRAPFRLLSASLHTSAQWGEGGGLHRLRLLNKLCFCFSVGLSKGIWRLIHVP